MVMRCRIISFHLQFVKVCSGRYLNCLPPSPVCQWQRPDGMRHLPKITTQWREGTCHKSRSFGQNPQQLQVTRGNAALQCGLRRVRDASWQHAGSKNFANSPVSCPTAALVEPSVLDALLHSYIPSWPLFQPVGPEESHALIWQWCWKIITAEQAEAL